MRNLRYYLNKVVLSMFGKKESDYFPDDTQEEKEEYQNALKKFGIETNAILNEGADELNKISDELKEYIKGFNKEE